MAGMKRCVKSNEVLVRLDHGCSFVSFLDSFLADSVKSWTGVELSSAAGMTQHTVVMREI